MIAPASRRTLSSSATPVRKRILARARVLEVLKAAAAPLSIREIRSAIADPRAEEMTRVVTLALVAEGVVKVETISRTVGTDMPYGVRWQPLTVKVYSLADRARSKR